MLHTFLGEHEEARNCDSLSWGIWGFWVEPILYTFINSYGNMKGQVNKFLASTACYGIIAVLVRIRFFSIYGPKIGTRYPEFLDMLIPKLTLVFLYELFVSHFQENSGYCSLMCSA